MRVLAKKTCGLNNSGAVQPVMEVIVAAARKCLASCVWGTRGHKAINISFVQRVMTIHPARNGVGVMLESVSLAWLQPALSWLLGVFVQPVFNGGRVRTSRSTDACIRP